MGNKPVSPPPPPPGHIPSRPGRTWYQYTYASKINVRTGDIVVYEKQLYFVRGITSDAHVGLLPLTFAVLQHATFPPKYIPITKALAKEIALVNCWALEMPWETYREQVKGFFPVLEASLANLLADKRKMILAIVHGDHTLYRSYLRISKFSDKLERQRARTIICDRAIAMRLEDVLLEDRENVA